MRVVKITKADKTRYWQGSGLPTSCTDVKWGNHFGKQGLFVCLYIMCICSSRTSLIHQNMLIKVVTISLYVREYEKNCWIILCILLSLTISLLRNPISLSSLSSHNLNIDGHHPCKVLPRPTFFIHFTFWTISALYHFLWSPAKWSMLNVV